MIKQTLRGGAAASLGFSLLALTACASLHVKSDVNSQLAGRVQCHTYAWAGSFRGNNPLRSTIANPVNENRLRTAIAENLQAKGSQLAAKDADCLVGYGIGSRAVVDAAYPYDWGVGYGWGWGWRGGYAGGWGWPGPYVYNEGIVAVDVYDSKSRQPLWHATVNQNLAGSTGVEAEKKIREAVAALFTKYPG